MSEDIGGKEKFIEILLIVMSLTLAGSKGNENPLFYFALFVFLTFAIMSRVFMALGFVNPDKIFHSSLYLFASFITAISFPSVLVPFFFSKLSIALNTTQKLEIFFACVLIIIAIAALILMVLTNIPGLYASACRFIGVKEKNIFYNYRSRLFFALSFMLICVINVIAWYTFMGDDIQPLKDAIQHSMDGGWIMDGLFALVAAFVGGLFTLMAVRYEENIKREHQKKYIATGFYLEIKGIENTINLFMEGLRKHGMKDEDENIPFGIPNLLNQIINEEKIDLNYKPLYSESGMYFQFLKEIYVFEDKLIRNILRFYSILLKADECHKFYSKDMNAGQNTVAWQTSHHFFGYIIELNKILPDLIAGLEGYVTLINSIPTTESASSTLPPAKNAQQ